MSLFWFHSCSFSVSFAGSSSFLYSLILKCPRAQSLVLFSSLFAPAPLVFSTNLLGIKTQLGLLWCHFPIWSLPTSSISNPAPAHTQASSPQSLFTCGSSSWNLLSQISMWLVPWSPPSCCLLVGPSWISVLPFVSILSQPVLYPSSLVNFTLYLHCTL